jgi:hypothetical protein
MQSPSSWLSDRWFIDPSQTSRSTHQTFWFLDLPLEARVRIYGYLVVVGKVFYIPDRHAIELELRFEDLHTYYAPSLQILRVCKQIRDEAEAIYALKNTLILPHHWHCCHPFGNVHQQMHTHLRSLFSARTLPHIKRASVSFSGRLCSHPNTLHIDGDQLHKTAYKTGKTKLALYWLQMLYQLYDPRDGSTTLDLDFLEPDFTDAYCPMGCCRMLMSGSMLAKVLRPKKMRLLGLPESERMLYVANAGPTGLASALMTLPFLRRRKRGLGNAR